MKVVHGIRSPGRNGCDFRIVGWNRAFPKVRCLTSAVFGSLGEPNSEIVGLAGSFLVHRRKFWGEVHSIKCRILSTMELKPPCRLELTEFVGKEVSIRLSYP